MDHISISTVTGQITRQGQFWPQDTLDLAITPLSWMKWDSDSRHLITSIAQTTLRALTLNDSLELSPLIPILKITLKSLQSISATFSIWKDHQMKAWSKTTLLENRTVYPNACDDQTMKARAYLKDYIDKKTIVLRNNSIKLFKLLLGLSKGVEGFLTTGFFPHLDVALTLAGLVYKIQKAEGRHSFNKQLLNQYKTWNAKIDEISNWLSISETQLPRQITRDDLDHMSSEKIVELFRQATNLKIITATNVIERRNWVVWGNTFYTLLATALFFTPIPILAPLVAILKFRIPFSGITKNSIAMMPAKVIHGINEFISGETFFLLHKHKLIIPLMMSYASLIGFKCTYHLLKTVALTLRIWNSIILATAKITSPSQFFLRFQFQIDDGDDSRSSNPVLKACHSVQKAAVNKKKRIAQLYTMALFRSYFPLFAHDETFSFDTLADMILAIDTPRISEIQLNFFQTHLGINLLKMSYKLETVVSSKRKRFLAKKLEKHFIQQPEKFISPFSWRQQS